MLHFQQEPPLPQQEGGHGSGDPFPGVEQLTCGIN